VSEPTTAPVPYQVVYSEVIREELRRLARLAVAQGAGATYAAALKECDRRLHVYPSSATRYTT
jgi:hypothetical protein